MPYVPLNKVATDLFTNGGEYIFKDTQEGYVGYYHKYYNGKIYTNATPDDYNPRELIRKTSELFSLNSEDPRIVLEIPQELPQPDISRNDIEQQLEELALLDPTPTLDRYLRLKNSSIDTYRSKKGVVSYNPTPSALDYQTGEFQRYFAKQINGLKYTEVDQNTFKALVGQNSEYNWQYYQAFSLPWSITGEESKVIQVNSNIVRLTERLQNIQGLGAFLQFNYLKFYKK